MNGTRPAVPRSAAPREAPGWRRAQQLALAALWLLGAVLQYETFMLSQGFPRDARGNRGEEPGIAYMPILML